MRRFFLFAVAALSSSAMAQLVPLQQGTATFSQTFGGHNYYPPEAVDGKLKAAAFGQNNGWAIYDNGITANQAVAFETATDITTPHFEVKLYFNHDFYYNEHHLAGRFRISVTDSDRASFCDGLPASGNLNAVWTVVTPTASSFPTGMTGTLQGDGSYLMSGTIPKTGTYTLFFDRPISKITGIRVEVLEDPSLPNSGPGLASNGNLVLSEITLRAVGHQLAAFSIAPSGVVSGNVARGTITISKPAGPGGVTVPLSDDSAALNTPASLFIPEGEQVGQFDIGTTVTSVQIMRHVKAMLNGSVMTRNLIVLLPDITMVSASPKTLVGGSNSTGTVTANGTAGNGFVVDLTSSGPQLIVPSSVTFTYGQRTKSFTINTLPVTANVSRYITATRNGRTRTVTLLITKP